MRLPRYLLALIGAISAVHGASAQSLGPGSDAPKIEMKRWLKGTPVTELDPNRISIVEFWATWCGPCILNMPTLTAIQKKNPDMTVIGVGIWEPDDEEKIAKFVKGMGSKIVYSLGYSGNRDGMAKSWMAAARQNGIPTSFIVTKGKVMWVGHPQELESVLKSVKAGTFDVEAARKEYDRKEAEAIEAGRMFREVRAAQSLYAEGKREEAEARLDVIVSTHGAVLAEVAKVRFTWLADQDPVEWEKQARKFAASNDPATVQQVSQFFLDRQAANGDRKMSDKAVAIVLEGTKGKDVFIEYLVGIYYSNYEELPEALKHIDRAIALFPKSDMKSDPQFMDQLKQMRDDFRKKLKQKSG